jgi:peptide deformylase
LLSNRKSKFVKESLCMNRPVLRMGHPVLLEIAKPVEQFDTPELHALVQDLFDTMAAENGAGIAAPQIGVSQRVVIFGFEKNVRYPEAEPVPPTVLINPVITPIGSATEEGWEGCLSVPGLRGTVPRFSKIRYQGFDAKGLAIDRTVDGFHARVVQHECDHLDGILYPRRITDLSKFGFTDVMFPELAGQPDD